MLSQPSVQQECEIIAQQGSLDHNVRMPFGLRRLFIEMDFVTIPRDRAEAEYIGRGRRHDDLGKFFGQRLAFKISHFLHHLDEGRQLMGNRIARSIGKMRLHHDAVKHAFTTMLGIDVFEA